MEPIAIDPALVERHVLDLAQYGACAETGVCRAMYTPEWEQAQRQVADWCAEAGMRTWRDAIGNQWGRLEGREPGPAVVTGSHIDTQLPGGRYDGALGVIAGVLAVRTLRERFGQPRRSIDVVSFCQEEGSRFPAANLWASRVIARQTDPAELDTLRSYDDSTMREVMRSVGLDPERYREAERDDIAAFIELHIEQGPILEHEGLAVGIVDAITGLRTYQVTITGRSDHAGGCPMDLRRDPMRAAAPIIAGVLQTAHDMGRPAVTTVGRMQVEPNFPMIVPRQVTFTVNARHPYLEGGRELYARHEALFQRYQEAHPELEITWSNGRGLGEPTPCSPEIVELLKESAQEQGFPPRVLPSGAGHDCQVMARRYPSAMIFVQSKDGRSHTPDEYTAPEHAAAGIQVLAAALHRLAY
jgi:allantoate deiminase